MKFDHPHLAPTLVLVLVVVMVMVMVLVLVLVLVLVWVLVLVLVLVLMLVNYVGENFSVRWRNVFSLAVLMLVKDVG